MAEARPQRRAGHEEGHDQGDGELHGVVRQARRQARRRLNLGLVGVGYESRVKSLKCCTHARELLKTVAALRRDEKDDGKGCGVPAYASIGRARGTGV